MSYKEELIKLTKILIQKPSISPNDYGCQNVIIQYLKSLNFNIEIINLNNTTNMWAYRENNKNYKKTFLFLGHTDVVPSGPLKYWKFPPFSGLINKGMLYGRGASDMKGALAAMLIATKNFIKKYPKYPGRIAFLITSDEESTGINGIRKVTKILIKRHEKINYCIVGEPTSQQNLGDIIKNGRRGSLTANLTIHGIQGHAAYPELAKNPIHLTIPFLSKLINIIWDKKTQYFPSTTMQITNINCNNKIENMIPDRCTINFNFRFNDQSSSKKIQTILKQTIEQYKLNYNIFWKLSAKPYFSKPGKLTNVVINTIKKHYKNLIPKLETTGGTSDGRFISNDMGAEVLELGLKNKTIHKINEFVDLNDLTLLSIFYKRIIEKLIL